MQRLDPLTINEFVQLHGLNRDTIKRIIRFYDIQLWWRVGTNTKISSVTLFKLLILCSNKLHAVMSQYPTAFNWPEANHLANPYNTVWSRAAAVYQAISDNRNNTDSRTPEQIFDRARSVFQRPVSITGKYYRSLEFSTLPAELDAIYFSLVDRTLQSRSTTYALCQAAANDKTGNLEPFKPQASLLGKFGLVRSSHFPNTLTTTVREHDGFTALHIAATTGNDAMTAALMSEGLRPDVTCKAGLTPLYYAVKCGHEKTAKLLVSKMLGLKINLNVSSHAFSITPWFIATELGRESYFEVDGVNIDLLDLIYNPNPIAVEKADLDKDKILAAAATLGAKNIFAKYFSEDITCYPAHLMGKEIGVNRCTLLSLAAGFDHFDIALHILNNLPTMINSYVSWASIRGSEYLPTPHLFARDPYIVYAILYVTALYGDNVKITIPEYIEKLKALTKAWDIDAVRYLYQEVQSGRFAPYQKIIDEELKNTMIRNTELFLELAAELNELFPRKPEIRPGI